MTKAIASWLAIPLFGLAVVALLLSEPARNAAPNDDQAYLFHFLITTGVSLLAFVSAFFVGLVAADIRDTRALLLFLALVSIGGFFALHGLGTPDVLIPLDDDAEHQGLGAYQVAGVASLFAGSIFFALSTRSWGGTARRILGDKVAAWMVVACVAFVILDVAGLRFHHVFDVVPVTAPPSVWVVAGPTFVLFTWSAVSYARAYALSRLPMQWALVMGLALLASASIAQAASPPWTWSWWTYHVLMLFGFLAILGGILYEFSRRRSLRAIMEGVVRLRGLVESELEFSDTISTLAAATEARDPETHGHTARVAEIAVRIGQELKLPTERLRVLARAGLLHDIGKLGIPDAVLLKPGPLTEAEWVIMRRHPELGHEIVMRAGSLERESRLIRMHHERLDGSGYNAKLEAAGIPLDARVLAVADVYDSLVSDRPYRKGFSPEKAMKIMREEAATHLDSDVVEAWGRIYPAYSSASPDPH